ncbi:MAG TPA: T9SS type A sorting domain-containing protein, partial [bacterium]
LVPSNISLQVFDISGRMVVELASGFHLPGEYRYVWDASDRAAGMYFVRLRAEEYASIQKMVLLK